jgi:15-hydroxyprostaglandin dehydrogenase (NAD)
MARPVALVTGGGSGIGLAITEHLVNFYGYRVAILDIDAERGQTETNRLNAASDSCLFLHVDVSNYEQQAKAFQQTFEWGGNRLDLFFANAGTGDRDSVYKDLNGMDEKTGLPKPLDLKNIEVNLNAIIQGVHLARHFFEKNSKPGGRIVVTASCLGVYPNHCIPLYTTSKHGLVGFVRATAPVFAGMGITINAILPTMIETNLMPKHVRPLWDRNQLTPMSTALKAFDTFLADDEMTGQTVELTLDQLIFSKQQAYSTPNSKWMCEEHELWEKAAEPLLPKPPGQNYTPLS